MRSPLCGHGFGKVFEDNLRLLATKLKEQGAGMSYVKVWRAVRANGMSRKRVRNRSSFKENTLADCTDFQGAYSDEREVISIDETCVYFHDSPRFGYSLRGQRIVHRTRTAPRARKQTLPPSIATSIATSGGGV